MSKEKWKEPDPNQDPHPQLSSGRITTSRFGSFGFAADFFAQQLHNEGPWQVGPCGDASWDVFEGGRLVARVQYEGDAARIVHAMNGESNEAVQIKQLLRQVQLDSERIVAMTNAIEIVGFKIVEDQWPVMQIVPVEEKQ